MTLRELVEQAHAQSRKSGWYDNGDRNIGEMPALIHSEVSEALEDWRNGDMTGNVRLKYTAVADGPAIGIAKPIGFPSELADIVIRVADLAGYLSIDLEKAVTAKLEYNAQRSYRHDGKRA
jgi:hypothetical protein